VFFLNVSMFLVESGNSLLATNILRHFQIRPVVVSEAVRSRSETLMGTFVNLMFDCFFGGTVAFALIKLTAGLGEGVIAYVEQVCC
jgi:hypothetical protein